MVTLNKYLNPKVFLIAGGVLMLVIGGLGALGVTGPTADKSIMASGWYFDGNEVAIYSLLGAASIIVGVALPQIWKRFLTLDIAALGFFATVYSLMLSDLGPVKLQNPQDSILIFAFAIWALLSALNADNTSQHRRK